ISTLSSCDALPLRPSHSLPTRRSSDLTVTADRQHRDEACTAIAAHPHLAHRPSVIAPPKGFFDALADTLARPIAPMARGACIDRSEVHTYELQSPYDLVCRLLLEKKNT